MFNRLFSFGFIVGLGFASPAGADSYCPKVVSTIPNDLTTMVLPIVEDAYQSLGCETDFVSYPVERALDLFNHGQISGELYRAPFIESRYTVPFVRSSTSLRLVKTGLWLRPAPHVENRNLVGYVRGIKWQSNYVEMFTSESLDVQFKEFTHYLDMFEAFDNDRLYGFLASAASSQMFRQSLRSDAQPQLRDVKEVPINHYLSAQYANFMEDFNGEMLQNPITAQVGQ